MKISFCCFFKSVISLSWFWKWFNSLLLINFWAFAILAIWLMLVSIFMKMLSCFSMNVNIFFLSSSRILFSTDAMIKLVRVMFFSLQIFFHTTSAKRQKGFSRKWRKPECFYWNKPIWSGQWMPIPRWYTSLFHWKP